MVTSAIGDAEGGLGFLFTRSTGAEWFSVLIGCIDLGGGGAVVMEVMGFGHSLSVPSTKWNDTLL